ncbi:hypothetical protein SAMN04488516_10540 [Desulfonauticus submarinus]|uniref:Uncharacterized protein n=1 Tax=Desulfonauticus submarinus TaxID=206665 RepID=A0A1H0DIZ8_9BACT|nr:hypothetical protein [Desulfonauticus submarinus]SDN70104.1 hypothetical protein SAMN04488516_10540 [Desulfonauticus submarinus]
MSKREKIILILAFITIIYGIYVFLYENTTPRVSIQNKIDIENLKRQIKLNMSVNLTPLEKDILFLVISKVKDPFLYTSLNKNMKVFTKQQIKFEYSGYVFIGDKKYAVINGKEYTEGERLDIGNFKVLKISKTKVILKGSGKNNIITIPFIDEITVR